MTEISPRNFLKDTVSLLRQIEGAFLELGSRFYKIREEKLYKSEFETFEDFILDARTSKATVSKLITVHEVFVLKYKIAPAKLAAVGWSSLYAAAPYADSKQKAEDLVEQARLLTRTDLTRALQQESGKQTLCKHEWITVRKCTNCSIQERVY